ncbi:MAG: beta-glucosidase BglX [Holdemanella sp.]|nr:beta-glucosidase BglX [Holdemanella sp.]
MQEAKLRELMDQMTLQEKIGQLVQLSGDVFNTGDLSTGPQEKLGITQEVVDNCGSVLNVIGADTVHKVQDQYLQRSRLKIPLLFMSDIIYGYKTVFPIPMGLGATWNPDLIREDYKIIAEEAVTDGGMVTFSPAVDIVRDARWGRCLEMPGEDPYLSSCFAKAMVEGFQNNWEKGKSIASCVKHYAGYGAVEAGREYNTVDMSERRFRQEYLPPYKAAVDAGCEMVMTSFNTVDMMPATGNKWLMDDVLRKEWGFDGVIITDYAAIQELIGHGVAKDKYEASKLAIQATVDIDMKTNCYSNHLQPLIENGEISEDLINESCWRILKLKNKLGLFEDPYFGCDAKLCEQTCCKPEFIEQANKTCNEALVLLKNDNDVLPLKKTGQKIGLIGPYADNPGIFGMWALHGDRKYTITVKKALEDVLGTVEYSAGCNVLDDTSCLGGFGNIPSLAGVIKTGDELAEDEAKALEIAKNSDVVIMAMGEHILQSGEGGARTDITLPEPQKQLIRKVKATGTEVVVVLFNGRPLALTDILEDADAILEAWYPGTAGGKSICNVLFGDYNPSGRLSVSFPHNVGQCPLYYSQYSTGRPSSPDSVHNTRFVTHYLDVPNEALFPFGYGLSYHKARYSNLVLDTDKMSKDSTIHVSVDVTNESDVAGIETVQLYIRDLVGSVVRPILELKGFKKVQLQPHETVNVSFEITEEMLRFYTRSMKYESEPGDFKVFVGCNSMNLISTSFTLK